MGIFTPPRLDWAKHNYEQTDFCAQPPGTFLRAGQQFTESARTMRATIDLLHNARLTGWSGTAGDAYRGYVGRLATAVSDYQSLLIDVGNILADAEPSIVAANGHASTIATQWNQATTSHADLKARRDIESNPLFRAALTLQLGWFIQTVGGACVVAASNLSHTLTTLHEDLTARLRSRSSALAGLTLPDLPSEGPRTIYSPITDLQWLLGQTAAAEDILELLNGPIGALAKPIDLLLARNPDGSYRLSPEERAWILTHLDHDQLANVLRGDSTRIEELLATLDRDAIVLLADADTRGVIRPEWADVGPHQLTWQERPVVDDASQLQSGLDSLQQGGLGDCTTLSTLGAVERATPGFLASHIQPNPDNGTYTVTLYDKDGNPVKVTVDSSLPAGPDGTGGYANGSQPGEPMTTYQIYEKAVASASARGIIDLNDNRPGYNDLNGVALDSVASAVTGSPTEYRDNSGSALSPADINSRIAGGHAINTAISVPVPNGDPTIAQWVSGSGPLYTGHAYTVMGVTEVDGVQMVQLKNPWGPGYDVQIPYNDWKKVCYGTSTSATR